MVLESNDGEEGNIFSGNIPLPVGKVLFHWEAAKYTAAGEPGQVGVDHVTVARCSLQGKIGPIQHACMCKYSLVSMSRGDLVTTVG